MLRVGVIYGVCGGMQKVLKVIILLAWAFFFYEPKVGKLVQWGPYDTIESCEQVRMRRFEKIKGKEGYWISPKCFEVKHPGKD